MSDLTSKLSAICGDAFRQVGLDPKWGEVRPSDRPELADFQCNGALAAAKEAKKKPRDIASEIESVLRDNPLFETISVAGPGFLNFRMSSVTLAERVRQVRSSPMCGATPVENPEKIFLDFGGPNVAKPMHVGHLRSAVIGDTLQRLFRFLGDEAISDTHLGDWGLQMGHLITALKEEEPDLPFFDENYVETSPSESPVTIEDLGRLYPKASKKAQADSKRMDESQKAVAVLQSGHPGYRTLLKHFIDVSVTALKKDYAFLNVSFDLWKGESDVNHLISTITGLFKQKGLTETDAGAVIVRLQKEDDLKEIPPLILINSRGGTGYQTTDLATIYDRLSNESFKPERIIYVVDQRQALHFEQVFRAIELVGVFKEECLEHVGFGTVNGKDGKPFKTREGSVLKLADLESMALAEAKKRMTVTDKDMSETEKENIARYISVAALRFADLRNVRTSNYVFDIEKFTSFEGKTGPYLLYAAVRIKSLLRRAKSRGYEIGELSIESKVERNLVLVLDGFSRACHSARSKRNPHILCEHLYHLAQSFSAFYGEHPIATENNIERRISRLTVCDAVLKQLVCGLDLLGIEVPERM